MLQHQISVAGALECEHIANCIPNVTGRIDVRIREPRVLAEREHYPVVAVAHLLWCHVTLVRQSVVGARSFSGLLLPEGFDPRRWQPVISQAAEHAIGMARRCRMNASCVKEGPIKLPLAHRSGRRGEHIAHQPMLTGHLALLF